jgi:TrmH family RNA methyltransferase
MITSTSNPRVRQLVLWQEKAKKRREDNVFLAEGIKMLREAPRDWIKEVYLTEEVLQRLRKEDGEVLAKIENTGYELLSDEVMKKVSDTQTPQGALVVLNRPSYTLEDIVGNGEGTFMVLENLQDPGNLGTIIRTGEGAGIRGVIMSQDTVDIYNPKTISHHGFRLQSPFYICRNSFK